MKSRRESGNEPPVTRSETVQVQVVESGCSGRPSPGTTGPSTCAVTCVRPTVALTSSPSLVTAGFPAVPVNGALLSTLLLGSQVGSEPYVSFARSCRVSGPADPCEAADGVSVSAGYRGVFSERLTENQFGVKLNVRW